MYKISEQILAKSECKRDGQQTKPNCSQLQFVAVFQVLHSNLQLRSSEWSESLASFCHAPNESKKKKNCKKIFTAQSQPPRLQLHLPQAVVAERIMQEKTKLVADWLVFWVFFSGKLESKNCQVPVLVAHCLLFSLINIWTTAIKQIPMPNKSQLRCLRFGQESPGCEGINLVFDFTETNCLPETG